MIAFVYEEENEFVLVVPDINNFKVRAKRQSEVIHKAINRLEENFMDKIENTSSNSIEYFMSEYKKEDIPFHAILYPLPIKIRT